MTELNALYAYTETQPVADQIKALLHSSDGPAPAKRQAVAALTQFERTAWVPAAFEDALGESPLAFNGGACLYDDAATVPPAVAITQLLAHYQMLIIPPDDAPLGIKEAAEYLGVALDTMKKYAYRDKAIPYKKIGRAAVFTRADLDAHRLRHNPAPGRPTSEPSPTLDNLAQAVQAALADRHTPDDLRPELANLLAKL